jgi:hypothetical protein
MPAPGQTRTEVPGLGDNGATGTWPDLSQNEVALRVLNTDMRGWLLIVPEGNNLLGREPDCRLHLPHHTISRRHCSVRVLPDAIDVVDLNSMNGTLVNGALVREARLQPGDQLRVGEVDLSVEVAPRPAARPDCPPPPPPPPAELPPNISSFHFPTPSWAVRSHAETIRYREVKRTVRFDPGKRDAFRQFRGP